MPPGVVGGYEPVWCISQSVNEVGAREGIEMSALDGKVYEVDQAKASVSATRKIKRYETFLQMLQKKD